MGLEGLIVLIIALAVLGVIVGAIVLTIMYLRYLRADDLYESDTGGYGSLVQCPKCNYLNPPETTICLNCRQPLRTRSYTTQPLPPQPAPPFNYEVVPQAPVQPVQIAPVPQNPMPRPSMPPQATVRAPVPAAVQPAAVPPQPVEPARPKPVLQPAPPRAQDAPPDMPHAWLEGIEGPFKGRQAVLSQSDTLVGRSTSCNIQIPDPKVSRKHFAIRYSNGKFYLQDQESSRGTRINGQLVAAQSLKDGDQIEIGDTSIIFRTI